MRRSLTLALTTTVVALFLLGPATPAAGAPYPMEVTGGLVETVLGDFELTPGSQDESPCVEDPPPGVIDFTAAGTSASGTWEVQGGYKIRFQLPGSGSTTTWYQADLRLTGGGTYTASQTPPPAYSLDPGGFVFAELDLYEIAGPDCAKDDLKCEINALATITHGELDGTLPGPLAGDVAAIEADTVTTGFPIQTASCGPPFASVHGTDATLSVALAFV